MQKRASTVINGRRVRRAAPPRSIKKRIKTFLALSFLGTLSLAAVVVIFFLLIFVQVSKTLPSLAEIGSFKPSEGTKIFFADGPVMAILATENRRPIKLQEMGKYLAAATVATEDKRFYEHPGVDLHGVARAIWRNVSGGDLTGQGASTITQQLARNINELGLTKEKKLRRKVAEAILAMRLEQTYTKDEILELYLNQVYYGNGAYGAEAASRAYFHKDAKNLTLPEAAMLAGLPQRPSLYSEDRDKAYQRRNWVLDRMVECGKITPEERDKARGTAVKMYKARAQQAQVLGAPYFVNYVVAQLEREYGVDAVYSGWRIYTTLDSRLQSLAEKSLRDGVHRYSESANQGALICLDPRTGFIRAMVGGLEFKKQQFNVVTSGNRQAGSSFKPIVYSAAFDTGTADLEKTYVDDPSFPGERAGNTWHPHNYGGGYSGRSMTVLTAIEHSVNTIAVKVAMDTGLHTVIDYAHRLGITSNIDPYPTLALGAWATGVKPIDLCSAYTVFANPGGRRPIPFGIQKVVATNGDIIEENAPRFDDPHLRPQTLQMINQALLGVVQEGTGTAAQGVPNAHGKTGTTSDNRDAWFAGYTPELTTVVWAGREHRNRKGLVDKYLEMPGATGGHVCAPIWHDFMMKAVPIQQAFNKASAYAATHSVDEATPVAEKREKPANRKPRPDAVQNPGSPDGTQPPVDPNAVQPGQSPDSTTPPQPAESPDGAPAPTNPGVQPGAMGPGPGPSMQPVATARRADSGPRMSEPVGRIAPPPVRAADPGDEMVTVRICADSGRLANDYCPTTILRRMSRRNLPRTCRMHRAPN